MRRCLEALCRAEIYGVCDVARTTLLQVRRGLSGLFQLHGHGAEACCGTHGIRKDLRLRLVALFVIHFLFFCACSLTRQSNDTHRINFRMLREYSFECELSQVPVPMLVISHCS